MWASGRRRESELGVNYVDYRAWQACVLGPGRKTLCPIIFPRKICKLDLGGGGGLVGVPEGAGSEKGFTVQCVY